MAVVDNSISYAYHVKSRPPILGVGKLRRRFYYLWTTQGLDSYFTIDTSVFNLHKEFEIEVLINWQWESKYDFEDFNLLFKFGDENITPTRYQGVVQDMGVYKDFCCFACMEVPTHQQVDAIVLHVVRKGGPQYNVKIQGYLKVSKHHQDQLLCPVVCSDDFGESSEPFEVVGYQTD